MLVYININEHNILVYIYILIYIYIITVPLPTQTSYWPSFKYDTTITKQTCLMALPPDTRPVLPPGQPRRAGTRPVLPPDQPRRAGTRPVLPLGQPRWAGTRPVENTHHPLSQVSSSLEDCKPHISFLCFYGLVHQMKANATRGQSNLTKSASPFPG